jgi:hypothetical protein
MSDPDQTSTLAEEAPVPPPVQPAPPSAGPGQPGYAAPAPRFFDQVLRMRGVIAVALAMLIIGGLGGFVIGERTNGGDGRFGHGPGGFHGGQRVFPGGPQGAPGQPGQQPFNPGQPQAPGR